MSQRELLLLAEVCEAFDVEMVEVYSLDYRRVCDKTSINLDDI